MHVYRKYRIPKIPNVEYIYVGIQIKNQRIYDESSHAHLPPNLAPLVPLDAQPALAPDLLEPPALELVALVRGRGEAHRADVVRARVRLDRVRAALPDARREIHARDRVRHAVPVEDELRAG